jgi:hypothetical protein
MYSKQPATLVRQQFWTAFGQYMRPVISAGGEKINWVNYKTGIKFIRINMQCEYGVAFITIELSHPDTGIQGQQFDELLKLKKQFQESCGADWQWLKLNSDDDKKFISSITACLQNVHVLNQSDWPTIISFLKPRIIALDKFWNEYQFALQ